MDTIGSGNKIMCAKSGHMFTSQQAAQDCARDHNQCKPCPYKEGNAEDMHWNSKPYQKRKKGWFK